MNELFLLDKHISDQLFDWIHSSKTKTQIATFGATKLFWVYTIFTFLIFNQIWGVILLVMLFPWVSIMFLSETLKRKRPFRFEHKKPLIHLPIETPSFPSAHATLSFALFSIYFGMILVFDISPFFLFAMIPAFLISLSRVCVGVHYVSDIIAGSLMGFLFGLITFLNI